MLRHWPALTLFLREPGAALVNNVVERALKKAILHRKNSLFYKTLNGAEVGDLYMSLIHTCELNDVNPFDYLTELQRHADELAAKPADWMPWNYRTALERSPFNPHYDSSLIPGASTASTILRPTSLNLDSFSSGSRTGYARSHAGFAITIGIGMTAEKAGRLGRPSIAREYTRRLTFRVVSLSLTY